MTPFTITTDIERAPWTDLTSDTPYGRLTRIGLLRNGSKEGRATVAVAVTLPDGQTVIGETTWRVLHNAVRALAVSPAGSEETQD